MKYVEGIRVIDKCIETVDVPTGEVYVFVVEDINDKKFCVEISYVRNICEVYKFDDAIFIAKCFNEKKLT